MSIIKKFAKVIYQFLDRKINISEFESYIYDNSESISKQIDSADFSELLSFNYKKDDDAYELGKILNDILEKYVIPKNIIREVLSIRGTCVTNIGRYSYDKTDRTFDLKVGNTYNILTIDFKKESGGNDHFQYVIMDDKGYVYLIPSELLKLEQMMIPPDWIIWQEDSGNICIEPKEWNDNFYKGTYSFWEDFHDDEEPAMLEFTRVLHKLNIEVPERYKPWASKLLIEELPSMDSL